MGMEICARQQDGGGYPGIIADELQRCLGSKQISGFAQEVSIGRPELQAAAEVRSGSRIGMLITVRIENIHHAVGGTENRAESEIVSIKNELCVCAGSACRHGVAPARVHWCNSRDRFAKYICWHRAG